MSCSPWLLLSSHFDSSFTPSPFFCSLLAICPSLSLSLQCTLVSSPIPPLMLPPRCECIYNVEHVHSKLFSPSSSLLSLPLLNGYCDRPKCVCVFASACQTRAYGVPSCQHMPGGFSMPVLACTHLCVCVAKARHAAVCRDKGQFHWFLLSSCHPLCFCSHCVAYPFSP